MRCFVFQASLYCAECGESMRADKILGGADPAEESSDILPQGPYAAGESDTPQHCEACGEFLRNPLTLDGAEYVREALAMRPDYGIAARVWAPFYGF